MSASNTKKKTILRVKRKFSDIEGSDIIVLSQPTRKRQRTVPWNELTASFNSCLNINSSSKSTHKTKIENFFDYDCAIKRKKHIFRLIDTKQSLPRSFQQTKLNKDSSQNRKLKILKQRRSDREQYFDKIHSEITSKTNIIHHDDLMDNSPFICNKKGANKKAKHIEYIIKNKLLEKQKASRSTKIATKKQMNALRTKNKEKKRSLFDNKLIPKHIDCGMDITQMNDDYDIINIENIVSDDDEYDYYELDEDCDADQVISAIQSRLEWKKREKEKQEIEAIKHDIKDDDDANNLDLEWKLEKIKNKHLNKHFDANYEGPSFGYQYTSKESEASRFCEIERSDFVCDDDEFMNSNQIQTYYENLINEFDEIEKEDERYIYNEYPDEHELSDDGYCLENDYYPQNDENALDIDFFNEFNFN